MGKRSTVKFEESSFSRHKSYAIDEIIAAGGTTAFAIKMGKNFHAIDDRLQSLAEDAFLTKEEANKALQVLDESK